MNVFHVILCSLYSKNISHMAFAMADSECATETRQLLHMKTRFFMLFLTLKPK